MGDIAEPGAEDLAEVFPLPPLALGLSKAEVQSRQEHFGFNEVVAKKEKFIITLLKKFIGPVEIILELLAIYFFVIAPFLPTSSSATPPPPSGNGTLIDPNITATPLPAEDTTARTTARPWVNGIIVVCLILTNITMSLVQSRRAAKALASLKQNLQVTSRVLRDGEWSVIPSRNIVPGDVVRLRHGDFVPADMRVANGEIDVDQSPLTGESLLISKSAEEKHRDIFGGSIVKRGECLAYVSKTGAKTFYGKSLQLLQESTPEMHVQKLIAKVSYSLMAGVVVLLVIGLIVQAIRGQNMIDFIPILAVLLVSGVPVALPTLFNVTLSLASNRLSTEGVLVTRLDSASDAAEMTILCSDKTGTLTQNRISVVGVWPFAGKGEKDILFYAALCSKKENADPIDSAIFNKLEERGDERLLSYQELSFMPFDAKTRRTEAVHVKKAGGDKKLHSVLRSMKGAVDVLAEFCRLSHDEKKKINDRVLHYSSEGCRTLAVARCVKAKHGENLKTTPSKEMKRQYEFMGLIAMADPPREDSKKVLEEIKHLGIRVIMLTGDSLIIAKRVAADVGLGTNIVRFSDFFKKKVVDAPPTLSSPKPPTDDGPDSHPKESVRETSTMSKEDEPETQEKADKDSPKNHDTFDVENQDFEGMEVEHVDGFAEIYPEDKHLIVELLQKKGYIVGMTGDGANDAPALKQAEVGIAVSNATDVAKSAASAVLMNEGLSGVVDMVKVGRQVHQKIVTWILNKMAKTFMSIGLIMVMYFITGWFVIDATKMVILLFLVDFVTVSIAGDNSQPSKHPEQWLVLRLVAIGSVIGVVLAGVGIGLIFLGLAYFGAPPTILDAPSLIPYGFSLKGIQSFTFVMLFYFGMGTLLSVRERKFFWNSAPSWQLLVAIGVDSVVVFIISTAGIPPFDFQPLFYGWVLVAILGALVTSVFNDFIKVAMFAAFDLWDRSQRKAINKQL